MPPSSSWTIVMPVKGTDAAKSRFRPDARRLQLAEAMALDAVESALQVAPVLVIGGPGLSKAFAELGATVMAEEPGDGLNGAIARALATVSGPAAVLLADLPALRPEELGAALVEGAMVADAEGTGTTLITGRVPAFGAGSRARHLALGYRELDIPPTSGLRLDVDSADALAAIPRDRLGPRTLRLA
jgi:2-phospho-L-lactate guanylyltransferase